jgi:hypothetical protein
MKSDNRHNDIRFNKADKSISVGKTIIPIPNVISAAFSCDTALYYHKKPEEPAPAGTILCLHLSAPMKTPDRLVAGKTNDVAFFVDPDADEYENVRQVLAPLLTTPVSEITIGSCIIEAKKGCNDYVKAATTGTHPYGKMGIVSPVITAECDPAAMVLTFRYMGTTSSLHKSLYFSNHPLMQFDYSASETRQYDITVHNSSYTASAVFKYDSIEKDPEANGIWYVCIENSFTDICDASAWINALQRKQKMTPHDPEVITEPAAPDLLGMLDTLHDYGVLSEFEWLAKREQLLK